MSREVRIDAPGAGEWIMERTHGVFREGMDHAFSTHRNGQILGGIVLCDFLGGSMTMHMAGDDLHWCTRELLWCAFGYPFRQLGCHKVFGPVRSDNYHAIEVNLRGGWLLEAVVRDVYEPGVHMMIFGMTPDRCPWLNYTPAREKYLVAA